MKPKYLLPPPKSIALASLAASLLGFLSVHAANGSVEWSQPATSESTRYGFFGWLDHRSLYGAGIYPEPFLVDDSDLEQGEARVDWLNTNGGGGGTTIIHPEIEAGVGLMTFELEAPYERDVTAGIVTKGFGNIDLGARHPVYQYVSPDGIFDSTFGVGVEVGIPTKSPVSQNGELVPKIFNDLRIGNHFTVQSILGYSRLFGGGADGGLRTFEYGLVFGYTLHRSDWHLPGVLQTIPFLELSGETQLNTDDRGHNSLTGNAGFRFNLKAIGRIEPRLGIGCIFAVDRGARAERTSGVVTSFVFEF